MLARTKKNNGRRARTRGWFTSGSEAEEEAEEEEEQEKEEEEQ